MIKPVENSNNGKEYVKAPETVIDKRLLDPHGVSGAPFTLPGFDGFPFRGTVPDLKEQDSRQPQLGAETHVDILDLSEEADLKAYRNIIQLVGNNYAAISAEERQWIAESQNWKVFIRWMLYYTYLPDAKASR